MIWLPPLATVWLFALSAVCGQKTTSLMDPMWANLVRLTLACGLLGLMAVASVGAQWQSAALPWFLLSGAIGFGIGDIGLFLAYERLGARLTLLVYLCLAPPFAALGEWWWMQAPLSTREWLGIVVILIGVALSVTSRRPSNRPRHHYPSGIFFAIVAGLGQGFGGAVSRYADLRDLSGGVPALAQAFQRCVGGLAVVLVATLLLYPRLRRSGQTVMRNKSKLEHVWPWMLGAVMLGPVVGVTFYQWSLRLVGNSALVQAIVSTSPIASIFLSYHFEKDIPTVASVVGAFIAVTGVVICILY